MRKSEEERIAEEIDGKTPSELLRYIAKQHKAIRDATTVNPYFDGPHSTNSIISKQRLPLKKAKMAAEKLYGKDSESFKHIMEKLHRETPNFLTSERQRELGLRGLPEGEYEIDSLPTRNLLIGSLRRCQKNR